MTLRPLEPDGNTTDGRSGRSSDFSPRRALLTLRAAVILFSALIAGVAAGILTYFAVHNPAAAALAGGSACAGAITLLDALIA